MKIITFNDIKNLDIPPIECFQWIDEMLHIKKNVILPTKISLHLEHDSFFNVMPCLLPNSGIGGVKVITRNMDRVPTLDSQILLYDYKQGKTLALMDANWITAMRTGAVAAHSIHLLANNDFQEIGVIGVGNTCRAAFKVLFSLYPHRRMKIKILKYKNQHQQFVDFLKRVMGTAIDNVVFEFKETYEAVVENSDVVISAVSYSDQDFCAQDCYKKGCLIVPIHLRGFMHCDLTFDKVYCDDMNHVRNFRYFDKWKYCAEISDVLNEVAVGREHPDERIINYNVGLSMHDINYAYKIYTKIQERSNMVSLEAPQEKFWI